MVRRRYILGLATALMAGCSSENGNPNKGDSENKTSNNTELVGTDTATQAHELSGSAAVVDLPSTDSPLTVELVLENLNDYPIQLIPSSGTEPLAQIPDLKGKSGDIVMYPPNNDWVTISGGADPRRVNNCWRFIGEDGRKLRKQVASDGPRTTLHSEDQTRFTIRHEIHHREMDTECFSDNIYTSQFWVDIRRGPSDTRKTTRNNFEIILEINGNSGPKISLSAI